jgi:hypothetical protein
MQPGREICVQRRRFNPHRVFHQIRSYAVETAAIIVFLVWIFTAVVHEVKSLLDAEFSKPVHAAEVHDPCHITLPVFRSG